MDYYRRYIADYLADTLELSMVEDGAYGRLLDYYYTKEKPLPVEIERIHDIARARKPAEKMAIAKVLESHFVREADGWHNTRADKELGIAVPKIEKLREVARENGKKSKGRPKKENPDRLPEETGTGSKKQPNPVPTRDVGQPPTASHQPDSKPTPKQRIPGDGHSSDSAATLGAAALAGLKAKPMTLDQAKIEGGEDTPAATLAAVLFANGIKGNAFHPLVVEWARDGVTVEQLKDAIARARQRPGKDKPGSFGCEYLDPILNDPTKPAAQVHAEKATKAAAHSVEKANEVIAAGRAAAAASAPMPEALIPRRTEA